MLSALFILLQAATPASAQPLPTLNEVQFTECLTLARTDAASAVMDASLWSQQGGGYLGKSMPWLCARQRLPLCRRDPCADRGGTGGRGEG